VDAAFTAQLFLGVQAVGMALWASLAALNNLQDFRGAVAAVGRTLSMAPLDADPAVPTLLRSRAIRSAALHRLALCVVLALQILAAAALWTGCALWLLQGAQHSALPWLNLGLAALSVVVMAMVLGGMATAYWIRQEGLQLTHCVLLLWPMAVFALWNL